MKKVKKIKYVKNKKKMKEKKTESIFDGNLEELEQKAFMEGYNYAIRLLEEGKGNRR